MTEAERKQRSEKSAVIVVRLVRVQLRAMGCERFDLGIRRDGGEMILREGQGTAAIAQAIKWLRHENAKGAHIYIRPAGPHGLSLIDDLTAEAIERMKAQGFAPAVVVETSPNNFQAWLNHGRVLEPVLARKPRKRWPSASEETLRVRIGDISEDWRDSPIRSRSGNCRQEQRPFARLRSATGQAYSKAAEFLAMIQRATRPGESGCGATPTAPAASKNAPGHQAACSVSRRSGLWRRSSPIRHGVGQPRCRHRPDAGTDQG